MKDITLYPSSWYYNACVHGFLEVLEHGMGTNTVEKEILNTEDISDGTVRIPGHLLEKMYTPLEQLGNKITAISKLTNLAWWWISLGAEKKFFNKTIREKWEAGISNPAEIIGAVFGNLLAGPTSNYRSLGQSQWPDSKKIEFLNSWFSFDTEEASGINCGFCGTSFNIDPQKREIDNFFNMSMASNLGLSFDGFPNLTWDYNPNLPVCKVCRSQFLCFHFVRKKGFFINTESHLVNWHLNRLISDKLQNKHIPVNQALLEGMKIDPQLRKTIGGWGMQRMEMIQFNGEKVDYFQIPPHLSNLFLIPEISYLVGNMKDKLSLSYLFKGRHEYFPEMIYKSIRERLSERSGKDPEAKLEWRDIDLILRLYQLIRINLSERGGMKTMNLSRLSHCAADAPASLKEDKSSLVFRLLELTRMGKKEDVYHLLLRAFIAESKPFPDELRKALNVDDPALFKNSIYAFIAGLSGHGTSIE